MWHLERKNWYLQNCLSPKESTINVTEKYHSKETVKT